MNDRQQYFFPFELGKDNKVSMAGSFKKLIVQKEREK